MKIERRKGGDEKTIVTAAIVDQVVLANIASKWNPKTEMFRSRWANLVVGWCVDYFERYDKPPGKRIEGLFQAWASDAKDNETVRLVEKFLSTISGEYARQRKEVNSDYVIDVASKYFNTVAVNRLVEELQGDVDSGDLKKAFKRLTEFGQIEMGTGAGVDVLTDKDAIREAFETKSDPLITYPGALGEFFDGQLERDAFIAFMGPEKRGKTWWLIDVAWRGMLQRRKVAFFEVGDMSKAQIMRRFMTRVMKRPLFPTKKPIKYPAYIEHDPDSVYASCDLEDREYDDAVGWRTAYKASQKVMRRDVKSKDSYLRLSVHPNSTISVHGIAGILKTWDRQGWTPDIIVIDYADILAPPSGVAETRDQINWTWKQLRALSQRLHCLVVTATQADAASYRADTLSRIHFSEDKRKFAHVTGMIGINQTTAEKEMGLQRLNWTALREGEYTESKCVHVAGCLSIANPAVKSIW